jgi:hypothetical protein
MIPFHHMHSAETSDRSEVDGLDQGVQRCLHLRFPLFTPQDEINSGFTDPSITRVLPWVFSEIVCWSVTLFRHFRRQSNCSVFHAVSSSRFGLFHLLQMNDATLQLSHVPAVVFQIRFSKVFAPQSHSSVSKSTWKSNYVTEKLTAASPYFRPSHPGWLANNQIHLPRMNVKNKIVSVLN